MKIENTNMKCPNCGTNHWESVDKYRIKPSGMGICTSCSFISYPTKYQSAEEIKKHYRSSYRTPPSHNNLFSGERKNHFHHKFLYDLFEKWKSEGLENPKICEVGAAFGFTLQWIKTIFPKAEVYGTELTTSFRRNAYHEFGIKLTEDIDESIKYDLIWTYKVIEHQLDPDKELERYTRLLKPDGHLYVSVPTWFNSLMNFGLPGFDLEYYYDPNHINVWTREMFENMVARAGWEIIKDDHRIYADTYLCKPNPDKKTTPVLKIDKDQMLSNLDKVQKAFILMQDNRYDDAIAVWPDYPQAWVSRAEMGRKELVTQHSDGKVEVNWDHFVEKYIDPAIKACPNSCEVMVMATDFAMRAKKHREATEYAERALAMKPENPPSLHQIANTMRELALAAKDMKEKLHYFNEARKVCMHLRFVSTQHFKEATDLIYFFNSKLPFPGENVEVVKQEVAKINEPPPERPMEMAL